ncbi:MAG: Asp-tRNA(Asn)/Glu-tRNA(Gln) amidotransferase GatCAB subunit A [bacterium]|nr:Asp-tRNA(Asn)/Glu-tRNA(Gln) amidotransferase GatCAB subunit A [bacterium]
MFTSIEAAARAIRKGEISAAELTAAALDRVAGVDGKIRALAYVDSEGARQAAQRLDEELRRGVDRGPLHGIPVVLKDNIETQGVPTTNGSRVFAGRSSRYDATVWRRLREAGAVLVGKAGMNEVAWGADTPPTGNPWDTERTPGVSSGGSGAAVAAGLCYAALGTDTGGSVRIPGACCGVVGLKPTYGRVSRYGVLPLTWSLDHVGPLARRVKDAAVVLQAIAGSDDRDPTSASNAVPEFQATIDDGVEGLRIGLNEEYFFERLEPEVESTVRRAIEHLETLGARVLPVRIPHVRFGLAAVLAIELASASSAHDTYLRDPDARAKYTDPVRLLLEAGRFVFAADYLKAQRLRRLLIEGARSAFRSVDILVTPTLPLVAWKKGEELVRIQGHEEHVLHACLRYTCPFNLMGLPAVTVPCGFSNGLPIGLQIAGKPFGEATILRVAQAYEASTAWHTRTPITEG